MKTLLMIAPLTFLFWSCEEKIGPVMRVEATLNTPFVVSAPAEVTFKENGSTLYVVSFKNYHNWGIAMSITSATVIYNGVTYEVSKTAACEPCPGKEVSIGVNLKLVYNKVIKETCVHSFDGGKCEFKIDSAQFILRSGI